LNFTRYGGFHQDPAVDMPANLLRTCFAGVVVLIWGALRDKKDKNMGKGLDRNQGELLHALPFLGKRFGTFVNSVSLF
jgi:hypothetical protein